MHSNRAHCTLHTLTEIGSSPNSGVQYANRIQIPSVDWIKALCFRKFGASEAAIVETDPNVDCTEVELNHKDNLDCLNQINWTIEAENGEANF